MDEFVEQVLALDDAARRSLAERRRTVDEVSHEKAVRAGIEAAARYPDLYLSARARVASAHVPASLEEGAPDAELEDVARLAQLAIDDALLGTVGGLTLHPNNLRELFGAWAGASVAR